MTTPVWRVVVNRVEIPLPLELGRGHLFILTFYSLTSLPTFLMLAGTIVFYYTCCRATVNGRVHALREVVSYIATKGSMANRKVVCTTILMGGAKKARE